VIHDPDEKLPVLARWFRHAMANPTRFWSLVALLVLVVVGLALLSSGITLGRPSSDQAWVQLEAAGTPSKRVEIAQEFPNTPAKQWALLQAASEFYTQGFSDLPANKDAALPALKKALENFETVVREAPEDSPQALAAAFGVARTLEARGELEKAIKQYEKVASTWKGTPEAIESARMIEILKKPETVSFYKELYAYTPAEATIPPLGQQGFNLPPNHPFLGGASQSTSPLLNFPSGSMIPPPPPAPRTESPKDAPKEKTGAGPELPEDVFAPAKAAASP
jgi:hypothetical protein